VQYHLLGFGGNGLGTVYNVGLDVLTGGAVGPEAGLVGTLAFLLVLLLVWKLPWALLVPGGVPSAVENASGA
jgi:hypothetical protein